MWIIKTSNHIRTTDEPLHNDLMTHVLHRVYKSQVVNRVCQNSKLYQEKKLEIQDEQIDVFVCVLFGNCYLPSELEKSKQK